MSLVFVEGKCLKTDKLQPIFFTMEGNRNRFTLMCRSAKLKQGKKHYLSLQGNVPILSEDKPTYFSLEPPEKGSTPYTLEGKEGASPLYLYEAPQKSYVALFIVAFVVFFALLFFFLFQRHGF